MERYILSVLSVVILTSGGWGQATLIDSIPFPGMLNRSFWGIDVRPDTIFLGADGPGHVYFATHEGDTLSHLPTGYTYNHGLIRRESSYLIVEDYSTQGAMLHELDLNGSLIDEWQFPPGIHGNASGVGDITEAGGGAIWFTVYHPYDDENYPYAYAYKWIPGETTFLDTVPLNGRQPYGVALKGDTLFYVIDNIHGDQERIYAYDLTNEQDLFWFELPDTPIDNDQRPQGLDYDGQYLYLIANRQGGSAFAHQTIFIYAIETTVGVTGTSPMKEVQVYPNPAQDLITIDLPMMLPAMHIEVYDALGQLVHQMRPSRVSERISVGGWRPGLYFVKVMDGERTISSDRISVIH